MGKIRMLAVTFQEPQNQVPVFFPGQVVSGVVTVDLAEPMQMQCKLIINSQRSYLKCHCFPDTWWRHQMEIFSVFRNTYHCLNAVPSSSIIICLHTLAEDCRKAFSRSYPLQLSNRLTILNGGYKPIGPFGRWVSNFKSMTSEHMLRIKFMGSSVEPFSGQSQKRRLMICQQWFR